ncbi:MAG: HD domain-containing phosphohydrolase [Desulfurivibrio sp.]
MTEPDGGCVLFVDDEENILRSLRRLCMDESFAVETASSGAEALALLQARDDVAVIVSDQRMPEMTGVEMLEQARQIAPLAVRILLTGYADIGAAMDSINRSGVYRYITKPWQDEELLQTVRGALQHYSLVKENVRLNALVKKQNAELKRWNSELSTMVQEQTEELQRNYDDLKKLNIRQRTNFKAVITAMAGLMEMRDKRMRSHAQNVAEIAVRVARARKMKAWERESLVVAALLHDIGKIGMPDVMLLVDAAQMDAAELNEYQRHPIRGQAALDRIEDFREAAEIIRHHHERYDGSGFPDRLRHRQIPLAARIIAIIDFVDKEVRRYRGDSGIPLTFKKVHEEAGRSFDPELIAVVEQEARSFYRRRLPKADFVEMELHPSDLAAEMTLSRDVFSGTGILLLSKGTVLNETSIGLLRRYSRLDPSKRGVFVSLKEEG